jgi:hypothetical protein
MVDRRDLGFAVSARVATVVLLVLSALLPDTAAAREPTALEVQAAAARAAGLSPDRALSAAGRARAAALLPALRVRVARDLDRDQSLALEPGRADQLGLGASDRLILEVRAEWDLARLVFEPGELAALEAAARLARERRELLEAVTRLYFERRRLAARLDRVPEPDDRARFGEVTALLDAMTAGLYTRSSGLRQPGRRRSAR